MPPSAKSKPNMTGGFEYGGRVGEAENQGNSDS